MFFHPPLRDRTGVTWCVCHMVCLLLPLGLSARKTLKWERLSPCILLWVNIPLKCIWLFSWTSMCFSCMNLKEHNDVCLLLASGWNFFPFWREAPIVQLLNLNDSEQNPPIHLCVFMSCMEFFACWGMEFTFYLPDTGSTCPVWPSPVSKKWAGESSAIF